MKTSKQDTISKDTILNLLTEEKEMYNSYLQTCQYYQIEPDARATAFAQAKLQLLKSLLDGKKLGILSSIKI
jgi:hypothetical protein